MAFSKKASLNMSINAIVMLVMAMALLGLGLTFIRGMMGGATGKLGGAIDAADLSEPPSAEKPITMDRTVKIKRGKSATIKIGFYNTEEAVSGAKPGDFSCQKGSESLVVPVTALGQDVGSGESAAYEVIVNLGELEEGQGEPGTYACSTQISDETKQFFLEITA